MGSSKDVVIRGRTIGGAVAPLVCTPLVSQTRAGVLEEIGRVVPKRPDLIEWRVDHYGTIADTADVTGLCGVLAEAAQQIPLMFTVRSAREGGRPVTLAERDVAELCAAACETGSVGLVDVEADAGGICVDLVRAAARRTGTALIVSHHDFEKTPTEDAILARFTTAAQLGADIAKVAVMPSTPDDVLTLLRATYRASQALDIPLISMSMGGLGVVSRVAGWLYGSSVTFAVGQSSSAPGQVPIDDLRQALAMVRRAVSGG